MKIYRQLLLFVAMILAMAGGIAGAQTKTPVILSTDVGNEIDDQWAIAYLMANPNLEVLGIMSAHAPSLPDPSGFHTYVLLKDEIENRLRLQTHPPLIQGGDDALTDKHTPKNNDAVRFLIARSKAFSADRRLTVLAIGAATDVASAILIDPSIVNRIRVVAMAFRSQTNPQEYNVVNDVPAWQVLLESNVPVVIGSKEVCISDLPMYYDQAKTMLAKDGFVGSWLWEQWNNWYYREVKPLRTNDFSKPRAIWDIITLAYVAGYTTSETKPRPVLTDDLKVATTTDRGNVTWITHVDSKRLWDDFQMRVGAFVQENAEGRSSTPSTANQASPVPFYFDPSAVNPALVIGPPPAANSAAQKKDLAEVHRLHDHVSAAEMEFARKDAVTQNVFLFDTVFGSGFNARTVPVTSAFTERLRLDAGFENGLLKARFQRPRPFRSSDPTLKSECGTATEFSYPSGHSMTGYIIAYTLAEMVPEKANEIMARADQYAEHRVICSVHYLTDVQAGKLVALELHGLMLGNPQFLADKAAATKEIRSALHLPVTSDESK